MLGHETLQMDEHYTKEVEQKRLAFSDHEARAKQKQNMTLPNRIAKLFAKVLISLVGDEGLEPSTR